MEGIEEFVQRVERTAVGIILPDVVLEILSGVLQVEARLGAGVEALDPLGEPRLAGDEEGVCRCRVTG
jgi:hypothetical protein